MIWLSVSAVVTNPGRFGPIPVRSGRFGPGRFGPISGVSRFGPTGVGRFCPISKVGRFGPNFGVSRFGLIYLIWIHERYMVEFTMILL